MVLTDINKIFSKKIEIIPIISSVGVNEVYISLFNFEQQEEIFELRKIHLKEIEKSTK